MTARRLVQIALPVVVMLMVAASASAHWTTQGAGNASASVGSLNAPTNVSVPASTSGTVHVTWNSATLDDGLTPASGYYVTRVKTSDASTANACGTSPSSLTSSTATSCDDTTVPDGTYHYTVTAVFRSWTATSAPSGSVAVAAQATLDHFAVTTPVSATAGAPFSVTVTAKDASNNTFTGYTGTVHFETADSASPVLPSNYTFAAGDGGSHTFTNGVTLKTAGNQTITVNDTAETSKTGQATIDVSAATAHHFTVTAPATATAGTAFSTVTLTAKDAYNNTATGYTGNRTISWSGASTSPGGNAPSYPTGTVAFANGVSTTTLTATLFAAGSNSLTATASSPSVTGTAAISVSAAAADHFTVTAPATATAGTAFSTVTLTAKDAYNNTATGYTGNRTISWSGASTSPGGNAPSYPTGTVAFANGVSTTTLTATLFAAGSNSLTATASSPSVTGTAAISVNSAGVVLSYNRTCPVAVPKNSSTAFTIVVPNDAYGNSFRNASGIGIGLTLSNGTNFGFGAVGTTTTTVTITTGPATNTFTVAESGANKTTSLTATAPAGFTAPGSCTISAGN